MVFGKIYGRDHRQCGFTLIELMMVVAIVGILAAIAVPSYMYYIKRARYTEVITLIDPYRTQVMECITNSGGTTATGCNAGTNNIQTFTGPVGQLNTLTITNGVINATPVASNGIAATDTYRLTPTVSNGQVTWSNAGSGCLTTNLCKPYP